MISERPAHVEDRIEFGRWEGDLIIGNRSTALATLVDESAATRSGSRCLVSNDGRSQPCRHGSATSGARRVEAIVGVGPGQEIHGHAQLAESAGVTVYMCSPLSPWQRGSNENTNGLLRQWFPRSTDLYLLDRPGHLRGADVAE